MRYSYIGAIGVAFFAIGCGEPANGPVADPGGTRVVAEAHTEQVTLHVRGMT